MSVVHFTGKVVRRPDSKLIQHCPEFRRAMDAFQAALDRDDEPSALAAWDRAERAASAFRQGVAFALEAG